MDGDALNCSAICSVAVRQACVPDAGGKQSPNRTTGQAKAPRAQQEMVLAETMGFEPMIPFSRYAHLANECLQPLGHVSTGLDMPDALAGCKSLARFSGLPFI